ERERPNSRVLAADVVMDERIRSSRRILCAGRIQQKSQCAGGGIVVSRVEKKRPSPSGRVQVPGSVRKKRMPTSCCVPNAGGEVFKRIGSFRRGEVGIAAVRWRNHGFTGRGARGTR